MPTFVSNSELIKQEEAKAAEQKTAKETAEKQAKVLDNLAGHIKKQWDKAVRAKRPFKDKMLESKRAREGEYSPVRLQAIKAMYGQEYIPPYSMITETKCRAGESWLREYILSSNEPCWDIEPTPIPELPAPIQQEVGIRAMRVAVADIMIQSQEGMVQDIQAAQSQTLELFEKIVKTEFMRRAKQGVEEMKKKIDDQFIEGGWYEAFEKCLYDIVTYKAAVLKGPYQRIVNKEKSELNQQTMQWEPVIVKEIISVYERRSPFNIYPEPGAVDVDDGYIVDRIDLTAKELSDLIGVEGFNEEAIRGVLQKYRESGLKDWVSEEVDLQQARIEGEDSSSVFDKNTIECLEYWGTAQGKMLKEWGLSEEEIPDEDKEYDICAWLIGEYVIKAMINPDPLGKKPFSKAAFQENPDCFWGKGIPELIEHILNACNAVLRAIVNNVGMASGPQVEVNSDRLAPGASASLYPWKVWLTTNTQMLEGKAVNFFQPPTIVDKLQALYMFLITLADEDSGVPRYAHGETSRGGAAET